MTKVALRLFLILFLAGCTPSMTAIQQSERPETALLLIDLQRGVLAPDGPATLGARRAEALVQVTDHAIETALKIGIPVVFVKNEWSCWRVFENWWFGGAFRKGSPWAQVDPRLLVRIPEREQVVFSKAFPSAFSDAALQPWLEDHRVGELIVGGLYGDQCIAATVRDALGHGYRVRLVPDGIATGKEADLAPVLEQLIGLGATYWREQ